MGGEEHLRPRQECGTKHPRTRPFTPRHNGKAERYQRIMAEEVLYARSYDSEEERAAALATWNIHDDHHRPRSAAGGRPPASRLHAAVTSVQPSYSWISSGSPDQRDLRRSTTLNHPCRNPGTRQAPLSPAAAASPISTAPGPLLPTPPPYPHPGTRSDTCPG
ncbi:integrase core domain-containing protein [Streptomonospora salina]|uniref:integrase core domain-containing protein n=1 Tax=Streptomonospora salina TaxID=104205 RepID=UPI00161E2919